MNMAHSVEEKLITISVRTLYAVVISLILTVSSAVIGYNNIIEGQRDIATQVQLSAQEQKYITQDIKKDLNALESRVNKIEK